MEENKQSKIVFAVIGVAILLCLTVGLSFAIYAADRTGGTNTITTGTISMSFTESTSVISLTNALPVQDIATARISANYFEFSVTSTVTGVQTINYNITLTEEALDANYSSIGQSSVNLYLTRVIGDVEQTTAIYDGTVYAKLSGNATGTLLADSFVHSVAGTLTNEYRLRMWIPYSVDASSWNENTKYQYKLKLGVTATV